VGVFESNKHSVNFVNSALAIRLDALVS